MKTINRDTILTPTPLVCDFAIIQEHNQINLRSVILKTSELLYWNKTINGS